MLLQLILIGLGLALLMKGADFLVSGSSKVAKKFKIPEIVIGLTIVSIGTSLPELVISTDSALKGLSDISIGNVVGSNMSNLFFIIALCAIIKPLTIQKQTKLFENPFVVVCTAIFLLMVNNDGVITKWEGLALLLLCVLYILYTVVMAKYGTKLEQEAKQTATEKAIQADLDDGLDGQSGFDAKGRIMDIEPELLENEVEIAACEKEEKTEPFQENKEAKQRKIKGFYGKIEEKIWFCLFQIVLGIVALKFGGDFVVDNAVLIAEGLGISEKLISLTIVAFGTSLPELITCVSATRRGEVDLAVGNIVGSQIFNILMIVGLSAFITPIYSIRGYVDEIMVLLIGSIIFAIIPFIGQKDKVGRTSGIAFVSFYLIYMISLVIENLQS